MILINIFIVLLLIILAFQDYKDREVSIWLFCVLAVLSSFKLYLYGFTEVYVDVIFNIVVLGIQVSVLCIYFNLIKKRDVFSMIGLGDIFFFVLLTLSFSLVYFILFQLVSLIVALIFSVVVKFNKREYIPLAGIQASCLSVVFVLEMIMQIDLFDNVSLYLYLLKF